ncbi:hypothetical protein [Leptospira sarikeiensis]|uniref:Uncharacterized protein n=1 Tax=Leptospira sarikeiensis TaxID=2484943 RepID=A0A4R9K385_9LEPT|nr:hypothetical protein [Leptospira sarikeiensis]TGL58707.1 hypothetical protein EHQ64_16785 [Leptospira sarikeiensis]
MKNDEDFISDPPEFKDKRYSADLSKDTDLDIQRNSILAESESSKYLRIIAFALILGGLALVFLGYSGTISLEIASKILSAKILNSTPGLLSILLGVVVAIFSRPKIKIK